MEIRGGNMRRSRKQQSAIAHFKKDLIAIHKDWERVQHHSTIISNLTFLKKFAQDIQHLDRDALALEHMEEVKEKAKLVHHILTTPWGAPFVGETTLLEAATNFEQDQTNPSLKQLMIDFIQYGPETEPLILKVFDEISEKL
jgi:hypothetical protein